MIWAGESRAAAAAAPAPPWPPQYKLKPAETQRLTAADVVGPDGVVYPDWRFAGIAGGIPAVKTVARLAEFGGVPDDDRDDSAALEAGAAAVASRGGGALTLEKGVYHLDRPVTIMAGNVVLRGQGPAATKLVFRYAAPAGGVGFFAPRSGATIGPDDFVEIHAAPDGLQRIALEIGGQVAAERAQHAHWGGTFSLTAAGSALTKRLRPGEQTLTAVAEWSGGRKATANVRVTFDPKLRRTAGHRIAPSQRAALLFAGDMQSGRKWKLARDGRRGDREIELDAAPELKPGDAIELEAPATERWNRLVQNACEWGSYRVYQFRVAEVRGQRVRLNQPLRIDFPTVDGSTARQVFPVRRCGVEDLALEQTEKLWTSGVLFSGAWECWARNVQVTKAGRHPLYAIQSKWCEIRDCRLDDAWYHGGGGTAYVGWERSYDCLMDRVETWRMRHGPCVQWSASGNVIRNSVFHGSDAQWHAGWTSENLFENCRVEAAGQHGTYGNGGWASPPSDKAHGPEGPRNCVYACDLEAPKCGLWLGGMNEGWLILYNRIVAAGPGIHAKQSSFDHTIRGNAISLSQPKQPAVHLATADCTGVEIEGNRVYGGSGQVVGGAGRPLVERDNQLLPAAKEIPRPAPPVPSIFEWQRQQSRNKQ